MAGYGDVAPPSGKRCSRQMAGRQQQSAVMVQVEREYRVGEWRVHVHDAADNQWSAFMAAQHYHKLSEDDRLHVRRRLTVAITAGGRTD